MEALAPYRSNFTRPETDPQPLPHLSSEQNSEKGGLDIDLSCFIQTQSMRDNNQDMAQLSQSNFKYSYWTPAQLITHHASNGCAMHSGDLLGSGTQSGPTYEEAGSLLELSKGGKSPIDLPNGEKRTFLEDGDSIIMRATHQASRTTLTKCTSGPRRYMGMLHHTARLHPSHSDRRRAVPTCLMLTTHWRMPPRLSRGLAHVSRGHSITQRSRSPPGRCLSSAPSALHRFTQRISQRPHKRELCKLTQRVH